MIGTEGYRYVADSDLSAYIYRGLPMVKAVSFHWLLKSYAEQLNGLY